MGQFAKFLEVQDDNHFADFGQVNNDSNFADLEQVEIINDIIYI